MGFNKPRFMPCALALALVAAAPAAFSAEVWTTISSPAAGGTATTATGTLGSTTVTFTSVFGAPLLHQTSGPASDGVYQHIWDNATTGTSGYWVDRVHHRTE